MDDRKPTDDQGPLDLRERRRDVIEDLFGSPEKPPKERPRAIRPEERPWRDDGEPATHRRLNLSPVAPTPLPPDVVVKICAPGDGSVPWRERKKPKAQVERERREDLLDRGMCRCNKERVRIGKNGKPTTLGEKCWEKKKAAKRIGPRQEPPLHDDP